MIYAKQLYMGRIQHIKNGLVDQRDPKDSKMRVSMNRATIRHHFSGHVLIFKA
jgi:hypothetical protein